MNLLTDDPTTGAADATDYQSLSSGWALGPSLERGWEMGGFASIQRGVEQAEQRVGPVDPNQGVGRGPPRRLAPETPMLAPDAANEQYGIPGALTFDQPTREGEAKLLNQWKHEDIQRDDILDRSTPGAVPSVARFMSSMAGSAIDPVNLAASFIPVFGEARWAALAGRVGEIPAALARGAAEGFVGSALVEPITAVQQINQHGEYSAEDAFLDIGFGTLAGAGMRGLGAGFHEAAIRWRGAPMEARSAAMMHSIDALTEGRPVRAAEIAEPARVAAASDAAVSAVPSRPQDAISFIQAKGGLRDTEGHDLVNTVGQRQNPRVGPLIRKSGGMSIDDAGEALHEAGYFGDPSITDRPTEAQVLDFLRDASTTKRYQVGVDAGTEIGNTQARDLADNELSRTIEDHGVTVSEDERAAVLDMMVNQGVPASDALDHVMERSAMGDTVGKDTAARIADVNQRIIQAKADGATVAAMAPLIAERAELRADMETQAMSSIRRDASGEGGGDAVSVQSEASRQVGQSNAESIPPERMPDEAKVRATEAEQSYGALLKDAESRGEPIATADVDAAIEKTGIFAAFKKAAASLADCMVTHGV